MNPLTLLRLLGTEEFLVGLIAGAGAVLAATIGRRWRVHFGLVFSFGAVAALGWLGMLQPEVTERAFTRETWIIPAAVVAVVFGVYGLADEAGWWLPTAAAAISVGGIWATVPDTEEAAVSVGVMAAVAFWGLVKRKQRLAFVGAEFMAVIMAWTVAVGGIGRNGAVVGGLGALASVALIRWRPLPRLWWDIGLHVALVLLWTRVAGLRQSAAEAAALGVSSTVVVGAMRWLLAGSSGLRRNVGVAIVEHGPEPPGADDDRDGGDDDRRPAERNQQQG